MGRLGWRLPRRGRPGPCRPSIGHGVAAIPGGRARAPLAPGPVGPQRAVGRRRIGAPRGMSVGGRLSPRAIPVNPDIRLKPQGRPCRWERRHRRGLDAPRPAPFRAGSARRDGGPTPEARETQADDRKDPTGPPTPRLRPRPRGARPGDRPPRLRDAGQAQGGQHPPARRHRPRPAEGAGDGVAPRRTSSSRPTRSRSPSGRPCRISPPRPRWSSAPTARSTWASTATCTSPA